MSDFINRYPYSDAHELNLDWVIAEVRKIRDEMTGFKAANTVDYDGVWDITKQYEAWTVVLDTDTGYLKVSTKPVPAGISINNGEYWILVSPFKIDIAFDPASYNAIANKTVTDKFDSVDQAIETERTLRSEADTALSGRIDTNDTAIAGIQTNVGNISSTLTNEIANREQSEALINTRIDNIASLSEGSTTGDAELMDIRVGANDITYDSAGEAVRSQVELLHDDILECNKKKILGFNLFDKSAATSGYYVSYETGELLANANFYASDFIPVTPGEKYYISDSGNQQIALYDNYKTYVRGYITSNSFNNTAVPNNCYYLRITVSNANIDNCTVAVYDNRVVLRDLDDNKYDISYGFVADKVKSDRYPVYHMVSNATGLVGSLASATYNTDAEIFILLEEGTYNITLALLSTYSAYRFDEIGAVVSDHVNLIGLGKGATINLDLTGEPSAYQQGISTLSTTKNNIIKNLTVTAKNCRYAIHNDFGEDGDFEQLFENCKFVHYGCPDGNWSYPTAIGEGTRSKAHVVYRDCKFLSSWRAYFLHNQIDFDEPSYHLFENCHFASTGSSSHLAFALETLGSGQNDIVDLVGCTFNGIVDARVSGSAAEGVNYCDFIITGHGNGDIAFNSYFLDGITRYVDDEHILDITNNTESDWAANTPLKCVNGNYEPLASGDHVSKVCAVTFQDIASGETKGAAVSGMIRTTLSTTVGTKIGISGGALAVVPDSSDDYIGIVKYYESNYNRAYIKLNI